MRELIESTGRYGAVKVIENADSETLKAKLRDALDGYDSQLDELFFYFTGHGHQVDGEFFYCATNFDSRRPNETGVSNSDLHDLIRPTDPTLVVKVIDACNSGTPLIKSNGGFLPPPKGGLSHLFQFASCLDSQDSLVGEPLSEFTQKFLSASLRKSSGALFYTDVVAALRDEYISNNSQTPHFITQGTGRELFVDDVAKLADFRRSLETVWAPKTSDDAALSDGSGGTPVVSPDAEPPSLLQLLNIAEERAARPADIKLFIDRLFDGIALELARESFADYYEAVVVEHSDFQEDTTRGFIIRSLHREERPDNFVTADIIRKRKRRSALDFGFSTALAGLYGDDDFDETWDLRLNYSLDRAQMKVTLRPKFTSLQQLVLIVTCAPSLNYCYVFERVTQHRRNDFDTFDDEGAEVVRRWYKRVWTYDSTAVSAQICEKLREVIRNYLEQAAERLSKE
ncbi:MAG: hypothetical protein JWR84_3513 [Caulobacter sp.]|nr:hypothetical protein [Caulobacter sp.]